MTATENSKKGLFNTFTFTSLFCLIVAGLTYTLWGDPLYIHLVISFGYGYSTILCERILQRFFPCLKYLMLNFMALFMAIIIGSINAFLWLQQYDKYASLDSLKPVIFLGLIFTAICYYFFHTHEQKALAIQALEKAKRKESEQEKALILSQLNQLQSQIEPHFLFNTLANLRALIELDPKKATTVLDKLTDLMRSTLTSNRAALTNLKQETQLLSAYLDIQKIRLGDRLSYRIIDKIEETLSIPPFLIQPLVENALQHGIEPKAEGGEVVICFEIQQDKLLITISDNGLGLQENPTSKGNGISLQNIQDRLASLFESTAFLSIQQNKVSGVSSIVSIPLAQLQQLHQEHK
ncbi:sensor histidine kinase [Psychromonas sp. psych-6C06]|uniref:sensor histidine kinase n=1 Tax=Psychromonas sp. psych-6C06 TaxID=2058089 RepID=UPI000C326926|nr:histidine kinase [Psychromonas sp. psych-6C06]PKF63753.1 sensor histidine kinase [Psychromonas sp. psych-6C06]